MSEELREQIRNNFNLKDTYQLLEVWKVNDRVEWSDTAFEVLKDILRERISNIPPQDKPIFEYQSESKEKNKLSDWEEKLLDDDNQPGLYDPLKTLDLLDKIDKVAKAVVIINILIGLSNFQGLRLVMSGFSVSSSDLRMLSLDFVYLFFNVTIKIVATYFPLKALSHILRILMEMEFNSRKAKS